MPRSRSAQSSGSSGIPDLVDACLSAVEMMGDAENKARRSVEKPASVVCCGGNWCLGRAITKTGLFALQAVVGLVDAVDDTYALVSFSYHPFHCYFTWNFIPQV